VHIQHFHSWDVSPQEAIQIQQQLRAKVIPHGKVGIPTLIAGADVAFVQDTAVACVVLLMFPKLEIVESVIHTEKVTFPYIPGLLSFRETPALAQAFGKLNHAPDLIFVDGQGLAHPRAAGIACHIGVILGRPTIGCAKSLLCGTYKEPNQARGSVSDLCDDEGRVIGAVLRTRDGIQPVFVSIGHRIDLAQAIELTLACGKGYRVPEPTRQADLLAERAKDGRALGEQGVQGNLFG
jgi:deoxyribonuclease V